MSQLSLDKAKIRFLLLEGVHKNALDVLSSNGYTNIEYLRTALDEDALIAKIKDAHFVGIRSRTQITYGEQWKKAFLYLMPLTPTHALLPN